MRKVVIFLLLSQWVWAQKHELFPRLVAQNLQGAQVDIPGQTKGKATLLCLAYSQESEKELESWLLPTYRTFVERGHAVFESLYEEPSFQLYFVLMMSSIVPEGKTEQLRFSLQSIDKELQPHVLLYRGSITPYKKHLNMDDKSKPYFFILNPQGHIVHTTSGSYTPAKLNEIRQILEKYTP